MLMSRRNLNASSKFDLPDAFGPMRNKRFLSRSSAAWKFRQFVRRSFLISMVSLPRGHSIAAIKAPGSARKIGPIKESKYRPAFASVVADALDLSRGADRE